MEGSLMDRYTWTLILYAADKIGCFILYLILLITAYDTMLYNEKNLWYVRHERRKQC